MKWRFALATLLACVPFAFSGAAVAETVEPTGWAYDYFNEIMSPFCPGRTLSACTSGQAETLRMWILVQEASGRTRADVHEELLGKWGDVLLAAPRAEGFGVAAYALPAAFFVGGGLLVAVFLKRQTRSAPAAATSTVASSGPLDPDIERLIDEELAR